jgi:hypothetical protein
MATISLVSRSVGIFNSLRRRLAASLIAVKRAVDEDMLRRRREAILESLDKRLLLDAGIDIQGDLERKAENLPRGLITPPLLLGLSRFVN